MTKLREIQDKIINYLENDDRSKYINNNVDHYDSICEFFKSDKFNLDFFIYGLRFCNGYPLNDGLYIDRYCDDILEESDVYDLIFEYFKDELKYDENKFNRNAGFCNYRTNKLIEYLRIKFKGVKYDPEYELQLIREMDWNKIFKIILDNRNESRLEEVLDRNIERFKTMSEVHKFILDETNVETLGDLYKLDVDFIEKYNKEIFGDRDDHYEYSNISLFGFKLDYIDKLNSLNEEMIKINEKIKSLDDIINLFYNVEITDDNKKELTKLCEKYNNILPRNIMEHIEFRLFANEKP